MRKKIRWALLILFIPFLTVSAGAEDISLSLYSVGCPGGHHSGGGEKILTIGPNYETVTLTRACFDDNGYILVNGVKVWEEYNGCCSANCAYPYVDVTEYVHPGDNVIYGYADDCCGYCAAASAAFRIEYGRVKDVDVDIKPGSYPNSINIDSRGVIPVAILTTEDFDAADVNAETVKFGPAEAAPVHYALEDVDGDGDVDMILHFRTRDTGIAIGDTEAVLTGETYDGRAIEGSDGVRVLENKGKKK